MNVQNPADTGADGSGFSSEGIGPASVTRPGVRATINDVAEHAGVSRQTVSNALNHPERVRTEVRDRVAASITELGYLPSRAAQTLRARRAGAVGVELDPLGASPSDIAYPFLVHLSLASQELGRHIVPFTARQRPHQIDGYQDMVRRGLVDAFVIDSTHPGDPRPAWFKQQGIAYSAYGRVYDDPEFTRWVDVDGRAGTLGAVEHLLATGRTRIGYLGWPPGEAVADARRAGWVDGLRTAGIACQPERAVTQSVAEATAAAVPLLDELGRGGAVVCASDVLALGVLLEAGRRGWEVGVDVAITGFDGSATAALHGLTSVTQPVPRIAAMCLELVSRQLDGYPDPVNGTLIIPGLVVRPSTAGGGDQATSPTS